MTPPTASDVGSGFVAARAELLARPGGAGLQRRRALVALTDEWLRALFVLAGGPGTGSALVAVGGHGRRELAPGSDLDLLLLHPPGADVGAVSEMADRLWYPIWDAGLKLDHSVRTVPQARRLAADDLRVVLGILDARTVAGDEALGDGLRSSVLSDWRAFARDRLPQLRDDVLARAERAGELAHLLEPDVKESYGGLRDITVLRAVAASWVTDIPHDAIVGPHARLLDVRDALHLASGRASDRLLLQEQPAVAASLGDPDADALLRSVSAAGRAVAYAADMTWHRVARLERRRPRFRRLAPRAERAPLADGVVVQDGEVVLAVEARPDRDAVLVLRAAAAAAQAGLRLAPHAVARLAAESAPMPDPWPAPALDAFVSLLGAGRAAVPVWEALDQADVWTRLLPGWSVVRSAPQRNPVHVYTVDRHLVETAVRASALTRRVGRPDLLLLGALLHDLGKGRPGDHTENGVVLVADLAPRLGLAPADADVLVALVAHHLLLPETATRRDLDDPATVEAVAAAVGSTEVLELLHALTEADALATGPAAWSDWKASLVDDLVRRTQALLAGQAPPAAQGLAPEVLALAEVGDPAAVEVLVDDDGPATRVTVVAPDRVGLLATVAGVLSLLRLEVRAAATQTVAAQTVEGRAGGARAVQVWHVVPAFGERPPAERVREDVRRALDGSLDVTAALERRESSARPGPPPPPPAVSVVHGASSRATVIEVRAHDRPGLLHRVGGALAAADVSIVTARVATLGSEVVDVFYVVDRTGHPLSEGHAAAARVTVLAALGEHA